VSDSRFSRRGFFEQAGVLGSVPLIGTLMAGSPFQAKAVPQTKGKATSVTIPTHEFAGPNGAPWIEERIDFPANWDVHVQDMAGHKMPALTTANRCVSWRKARRPSPSVSTTSPAPPPLMP